MAFLVLEPVTEPRINSVRLGWNTEIGVMIGNILSEFVGTICLISQDGCSVQIDMPQNIFCNG